jgi:hypothetical protein
VARLQAVERRAGTRRPLGVLGLPRRARARGTRRTRLREARDPVGGERASALRRDADHTFGRCSRDGVLGPHHPPRADELLCGSQRRLWPVRTHSDRATRSWRRGATAPVRSSPSGGVERYPKARSPTARVHGPTRRAALRLITCGRAGTGTRTRRAVDHAHDPGHSQRVRPARARPDRRPAAGMSAPKRQPPRSRSADRALPGAGNPFASFAVPTILGERRFAEMKRAAEWRAWRNPVSAKAGPAQMPATAETRFFRSAG